MAENTTSSIGRLLVLQILLMEVRLLLRVVGFVPTMRFLGVIPRVLPSFVSVDERWAHEIAFVARPPLGGTCLDRSVAMWFVMRQHGIDGDLRIGVRRDPSGNGSGDAIVAHAWVEHFGAVVNDDREVADSYAVFEGDMAGLAFD